MLKTKKRKPAVYKRNIEDSPFYQFTYQHDELPLDPAREYIEHQIGKLKQMRPAVFADDLELHTNIPSINFNIDALVVPSWIELVKDHRDFPYLTKDVLSYGYLKDDPDPEKPTDFTLWKITIELTSMYIKRRTALMQENFRRIGIRFSDHGNRPYSDFKKRGFAKKRKKLVTCGDETKIRTCEELRTELDRMSKVIDKLIEPDLKRMRLGNCDIPVFEQCPGKKRIVSKNLKKYRQRDQEMRVRYQSPLQPNDPERQKLILLKKYEIQRDRRTIIFTNENYQFRERSLKLISRMSVLQIEHYPSKLILSLIPKIDRRIPYFKEAYDFIKNEMKHWPSVFPEVIFLDFLFDPKNHIPLSEAVLLIALLIDLQEDYRFVVKRDFLKYLLSFDYERRILWLEPEPPEFPIMCMRAPMAWRSSVQVSKNRMEEILMTTHPVLAAINSLWQQLYEDLVIVDFAKFFEENIPFHADKVSEFFKHSCIVMKDILINDWLPRVADAIDILRPYWRNLVSFRDSTTGRCIYLFHCIHGLMSHQLTSLIQNSIQYLYKVLVDYRSGNCDLNKVRLRRFPFMTISVSVVGKSFATIEHENIEQYDRRLYEVGRDDPMLGIDEFYPEPDQGAIQEENARFIIRNSGKMIIDPCMEDLEEIFIGYFKQILRVGYKIPRIEYFMTKEEEQLGYLHVMQEDHVDMINLYQTIREVVKANLIGPTLYLYPIYSYYFPLLAGKIKAVTEHIFSQKRIPELPIINELIEKFNQLLNGVYGLRQFVPLNLFMLDNRSVNATLMGLIEEIKNFVLNYFVNMNQVENRRICDEFEDISLKAGERPKETQEVVALQNYLNECREERLYKLKTEIKTVVSQRVLFLLHHTLLETDDINLNTRTFLWPAELDQVLDLSAARLNVIREGLEESLKERRSIFEKYIIQEAKKMDAFRLKSIRDVITIDDLKEKVKTVDELMDILEKCSREAAMITREEQLLQMDVSSFPVLISTIDKMDVIEKLWRTAYQFELCYENWYFGYFMGLDAKLIQDEVDTMWKTIIKLIKQLVGNATARRVAEQIRLKIDKFKNYLPILESICRQGMSARHWQQISDELGQPVTPELYPTLSAMIDIGIMNIQEKLEEISNAAGKEFDLNAQLIDMQKDWENVKFDLSQYRDSDTHILAALDDIQTLLDDHILKSQAMRGSPYIGALGTFATDWEEKLILMQDILDVWIQVQSTWMYLEPIFSSEDIMKQMPVEGRNFKGVDRIWRKIMKNTFGDRRVIQATDYPQLLQILQIAFEDLEKIQKGLNMYLEKKRLFFARFFFLSNDELLEILSETKDPLRVQPHLKKCFEGINSLEFDQQTEITGMLSIDQELVPFVKKINPNAANGLVEKWLKEVMNAMFDSIRSQIRIAYDSYWNETRGDWVLKYPGQAVLTVSAMTWTEEVEDAIGKRTLEKYHDKCESQILELIDHIRSGTLKASFIVTIEALIVLDVHAKDIVKLLVTKNVVSNDDFSWLAQLRYYWRIDPIDKQDYVCVSMVATEVRYGLEYLGNQPRLVVTPLTDRCYRTLMGAIKVNLGGAPEGPAGTGKTETCKDLAKAVAKKCVVFNCSSELDYKAIGKFLKGLAQSGAWACFDEFNRMDLEVLSVIAQQILTIQRAISRKVVKFNFEDTILQLDPTCSIFITMNPGYAGRTELPDNLKMLFRTVAMMVPDYAMIGEISLYSTGFSTARPLSQKIVHTYKLCSEQLSSQFHYDYGMRAIKSVLIASASLRKLYPTLPEPDIVLRAIIDVNLPKFLQDDIQLFQGIYMDLFPGTEVFQPSRVDIMNWMLKRIEQRNLQPKPWFIEKVMQIYEMLLVRHGVMIVGGTMAGKTTAYQLLAETLKLVCNDVHSKTSENGASFRIINPKAISIGQLYGNFDPVSHEWSDGVLAKTFREMANSGGGDRQWIIFDGPVDAVWIENLNTTLDDNKKLCLMSGEIIQMSNKMNLIFEPVDLEQASPATVSRVGMIYMEPSQLGWDTFHKSFLTDLQNAGVNEIYMGLYEALIDWLVPAFLDILESCDTLLPITAMHSYRLFTIFFMDFFSRNDNMNQIWFQQVFLFCFLWSFGPTVTVESRKFIDAALRKILYGANDNYPKPKNFTLNRGQMFPEKQLVYDYYFDEKENWWPWYKEDVNLPQEATFSDLMVPTKESGYSSYWLNICIRKSLATMLIGPTGTGKSAAILNTIFDLPKSKFVLNVINFSARTSAGQLQEIVMSKLDRRRKGVFGPPVGRQCIVFADDIGMPMRDEYGSQPPLELIRQFIDHRHWSDLKDTTRIEIVDLMFIAAMGVVGGSNFIYPRLYRHMFVLGIDAFEDTTIFRIFSNISEWHFRHDYHELVSRMSKNMCAAVLEVFRRSSELFLPTPAKSHYLFSLRDITRVYQGVILVPPTRMDNAEKLCRLWIHEMYRVFCDRLNDPADRREFLNIMKKSCHANMRMPMEQAFANRLEKNEQVTELHIRDLMFGNYMEPDAYPKIYDELENLDKLEQVMNSYLAEYNMMSTTPMDLVLFRFAIEHISRASRILQMPRGNSLLVGLGGSGRRSTVKLAASMLDIELFIVEIHKLYSANDWRDDIKALLLGAGLNAKPTVFLFSDSQAKEEYMIEDISSLLNTGELTNLFQTDDKAVIIEAMQNAIKLATKHVDTTPLALYTYFIERVREFLHIALAFSPIGDSFKQRIRMFPSLINCCTIDWFTKWPDDALLRVAESFIRSMDINKLDVVQSQQEVTSQDSHVSVEKQALRALEQNEESIVEVMLTINSSVTQTSDRFFLELGRKIYVTPTSYLEMMKSFQGLYDKKYSQIVMQRDRYTTGLEKLDNAAGQVAGMQEYLYALQPQLKKTSEETEKIMVIIERDTAEAEKKKEVVGADEAAANEAAAAAQAIKDDCESDLQEAIPALEAALSALDTLKPADITVVKSMKNPPAGVKLVLEAVCVIKGLKPERKPDASGRMYEDYWGVSLRMLGDMKFLESLKQFDKNNIPAPIMKKIRDVYIADRDFVPEKIKSASMACEGLCRWVRAMEVYDRVAKIVAPKKIALAESENELQHQMEKLNEKKEELLVILNKLQKLNDEFAEKSKEKKNLEDEIDNCEKKLVRAEKLIGGLGGEKTRWSESAQTLDASLVNVIGDVLLAAGCIAYLGPFTALFRTEIIQNWNKLCIDKNIPCSPTFTLAKTLGSDIEIREWAICGLPIDNFSVENGIIVTNARRWALMIDPQVQANKWIKNLEKDNNLHVIKLTDDNYMRTVETAVKYGQPVLLENLGESIDFGLFPILEKNIIKQRGGFVIKFGDNLIEYNHNFRFYMTTCLGNPHYLPETAVMVTLLNFMITEHGLRQQLLTNVVIQERPELQEKKEQLILESAKNRSTLYNVETKILQVLSSSEGNILEDENAINILSSSKILSEDIIAKQAVAEVTEKEIDDARQLYIPVSNHSSVLFFCLTELPNIDPMYHFSLSWFLNLFIQTILRAPKSDVLSERLQNLMDFFTRSIYENVCRSLFEKHKLIFAFSMCLGIMVAQGRVDGDHLKYLLQGNTELTNPHPNPAAEWLTDKAWLEIVGASNLVGLENFHKRFIDGISEWKAIYDADDPNAAILPKPFNGVDQILKMIILKALRPDKITPAVKSFISRNIGPKFVEPPSFNLNNSFDDSNPLTPLIFLLSSGSDPMANIVAFSKEKGMYDRFKQMSLGQGQGPKAIKLLGDALKQGNWVILQNIHVAESWMNDFEKFCNDLQLLEGVNPNFRLWCTSYPSKIFPVSVLQNSVKMTNEPPKGLKLNIIKLLNSDPLVNDKFFSNAFGGDMGKQWVRGVFSLLFFHSIVQGRKEFGPLGWNIPYEFNDSDLKISLMQLKMFLKQYGFIPFEGHSYLTGECNYGGRVTDDKDRRCLMTVLADIYNRDAIIKDEYQLSESGIYYIPMFPNRVASIAFIELLPDTQKPEVFGLHENADIVKNITECNTLFVGTLNTQAQLKGKGKSGQSAAGGTDPVLLVCDNILSRLPQLFDMKQIAKTNPISYMNSMNTVLRQEGIRFNNLIKAIKASLIDTRRAILGQISMIPQLENIYTAIRLGRIPGFWAAKSYPSLKTLGSYINDLMQRIKFFVDWINNGEPICFWLSGFYFTQSFLTAVLQNFCRRNKIQIDLIEILYEITEFENDVDEKDEIGFYAKGIFLEAARWNRETNLLDEPIVRVLFDTVPVIIMKPIMKDDMVEGDMSKYNCPIYKTSERRGTLSTTGHSTNFVTMIPFNTKKHPNHWIKRGTASLLQLTD